MLPQHDMILHGSSESKQLAGLVCAFCELVRRIDWIHTGNRGQFSSCFHYRTNNRIDARVLSTRSRVVHYYPCIDRNYFCLRVDFLFPQHCSELFDRGMHRCGLLEDVGKRCRAIRQRKKSTEQNSVSFINRVDCTSKSVESTENFAHIFGISHI